MEPYERLDPDLEEEGRRWDKLRAGGLWPLAGFLVIVTVSLAVRGGGDDGAPLGGSCTSPALALAPTSPERGEPVRWAYAGPDGQVRLALDTVALSPDGTPTARAQGGPARVLPVVTVTDCRASGVISEETQRGLVTVTVFRRTAGGWVVATEGRLAVR